MGKRARGSILTILTLFGGFAIHDFANPSYFPVHFVLECSRGAEYLPIFRFEICLLRTSHFGNQVEEFFGIHIDFAAVLMYILFSESGSILHILSSDHFGG